MKRNLRVVIVFACLLGSPATVLGVMDYRDWAEGTLGMLAQTMAYEEARLYNLGTATDSELFQTGMLISEDADVEDGGTKNVVLIECGMHGREWFATEACYWLIDHLIRERRRAWARDLLAHTDIWVIPQSNPAGRDIDDLQFGDPTRFAYVCDAGTAAGRPCSADTDCPSGACYTKGSANQREHRSVRSRRRPGAKLLERLGRCVRQVRAAGLRRRRQQGRCVHCKRGLPRVDL